MSENETEHTEHHAHGPSALAIFGWLLIMLAIGGSTMLLRQEQDDLGMQALNRSKERAAKVSALEAKIDAIQQQLANAPAGGTAAPNDAMMKDTNTQLAAIATRLDALEVAVKKPVTAPTPKSESGTRPLLALQAKLLRGEPYTDDLDTVAALPALAKNGDDITALRANAASGVSSELKLHRDFADALSKTGQTPAAASTTLQKVNSHLGGLVTIKPHAADGTDAYQPLRDLPGDTPLAVLVEKTASLTDKDRAPFDAWLKEVQARNKALEALHSLEAHLLPA